MLHGLCEFLDAASATKLGLICLIARHVDQRLASSSNHCWLVGAVLDHLDQCVDAARN